MHGGSNTHTFVSYIIMFHQLKMNMNNCTYICSTAGKPTHLFRTKCASLDSV
jgi:hypothetical protein